MEIKYTPVIGLEIHIQLNTASKMFCGCSAGIWKAKPNTHVCPVCLGLPGALPVINKTAVEKAIMAGFAFNCQINKFTKWDRKNYFYPDLPKGYQISQYDLPLCQNGWFELKSKPTFKVGNAVVEPKPTLKVGETDTTKKIRIRRVHLEEDTAKSLHRDDATLLDFNKSGIPLLEIVTEPDISSAEEAVEFGKRVREILRAIGATEGNMERGQMRFEVNISIQQSTINNQQLPPYKVEVKNINSFRFLKQATEYEIRRQTEFLEKGKAPIQETRGFDETKSITFTQRFKEETQDYRYFPEPDLPPLRFTDEEIETLKSKIPKLPQILIQEIISELGISENQAKILAKNRKAFISAKALITGGIEPQKAANLIINRPEVLAMKPEELLEKIKIEEESRVGDRDELSVIIQKVIRDNPNPIRDYQSGKKEALKFLIGQVMRVTSGRADPQVTKETLENLLQQSKPTLDK